MDVKSSVGNRKLLQRKRVYSYVSYGTSAPRETICLQWSRRNRLQTSQRDCVSLWGTQRGQGGRDTPSPPWPRWSQHDDDGEDDCDFEFLLGCVTQRIWEVSYRRHGCLFPFDFEMKSRFENVCPRFSFDDIFTFTIHVKAYTYRKHKSACYTWGRGMAESDLYLLYEKPRNSLEKTVCWV